MTGVCPPGHDEPTGRLVDARHWFEGTIAGWVDDAEDRQARVDALLTAVREKLALVEIHLGPNDDAQVIFETLNDRGTRLSASDLVKNTLFRRAEDEGEALEELFEAYWAPFDNDFWQSSITTGRIRRIRLDVLLSYG